MALAVDRIFGARPDGKVKNTEYLEGLTETLMALTDQELGWISDPREGLATRCKFLPTPADVFELIRERQAAFDLINPRTSWKKFEPEPPPRPLPPRITAPFEPFPKLWAAFAGKPEILEGHPFDKLFDASRALATEGIDAAERILRRTDQKAMTDADIAAVLAKSKYRGTGLSDEARATIGLP